MTSTSPNAQSASRKAALAQRLPKGTWDTHMHVLDPVNFKLSPKAAYTPSPHTLEDAMPFYSSLGIHNLVFVQPSIYSTDNSCTLLGLKALGDHGRAIVELDPATTSPSTLLKWHELGVRGVRINLRSSGVQIETLEVLNNLVKPYADLIRPLNWFIDFHISMSTIPLLHQAAPSLAGIKLCIDHFGSPDLPLKTPASDWEASGLSSLPGFSSLVTLLASASTPTFVKISAPYRFSSDPLLRDIEMLTKELLSVAPDRCIFATDWPHTRFEGMDVVPFVEGCLDWADEIGGRGLVERLFRRNAEELLDG